MKFYLWGGRGGDIASMKDYIAQILQQEHIKELLHIPFAGAGIRHKRSGRCMPKEFQIFIENLGVKYFDASYEEDIDACSSGHIYINGGHYRDFLLQVAQKPKLLEKLQNANIIIGESSGAMIFGETVLNDKKSWFVKGLGLVNHTIIQPHYWRRQEDENVQNLYAQQQTETHCDILWIDETTFVEYENGQYGEVIWKGGVYHL